MNNGYRIKIFAYKDQSVINKYIDKIYIKIRLIFWIKMFYPNII